MAHQLTDGDKAFVKVTVGSPCGCCHFEINFSHEGGVGVTSKGLTEEKLKEQIDKLAEYLPVTLNAVAAASPDLVRKSTVQ